MARKKVKHAMIPNEKVRKSTLKRRVENLYKKAHELSILCNIEMFIVLLNRKEGELTLWPSQDKAMKGIAKFLDFPEQERLKKMVLQEKHLTDKMQDVAEQISKLRKNNNETEMKILMKQVIDGKSFDELDLGQINGLNHLIDENLKKLQRRGDELDEMQRRFSVTGIINEGNQGEITDEFTLNQEWPTIFSP
ncbi:agamous-like mads-box protein agl80 [Phtheirospermum japonicum]|uniref:Agamous-like mads-box protein agl80 n=1 Tax=Phtheirospermum japonicum TaxID=374723 RepID=A0A830CFC1_9LAMI|nr:agamous-like mads-box protein agl80 [Phtheirospermum japonicum]